MAGWNWLALAVWLLLGGVREGEAQGIVVLGKTADDKVLIGFLNQNGNANTLLSGLNSYGTTRLGNNLLPLTIDGRILNGTFDGTNRLVLRTWDTNLATLQVFEFTLNTNVPLSTNVVSRVGFPENLQNKTLNNWKAATNGVAQSGVLVARGNDFGMAVAGKAGTNRIQILDAYTWATPTNYLEFKEGVLTAAQ